MSEFLAHFVETPAQYIGALMFYVFSTVLLFSGVMVVSARNPVHSVLFLILAFFNAAGLFLMMGAEFLAMVLVIVYVGAVAVLFLFVVMMLDIDFSKVKRSFSIYLPIGLVAGLILLAEVGMLLTSRMVSSEAAANRDAVINGANNTALIGNIIYTKFMLPFEISGLILLVAMIGAIVLTHRERTGVRRQNVVTQGERTAATVLQINKVATGEGVHDDANRA